MIEIGHIENGFFEKFGIPRQSGLVDEVVSRIVMEPPYRTWDAFKGIEEYTHLWILWEFSAIKKENWSATVKPPRLGGNKRVGVFATRSPFRPNSIGLSSVKLLKIEHDKKLGTVLYVSGADLMNGTPIYDIKPYLPYVDCHLEAEGGFAEREKNNNLVVNNPECLYQHMETADGDCIKKIIEQDPRPAYIEEPSRVYGFVYGKYNVKFCVKDKDAVIVGIEKRVAEGKYQPLYKK